MMAERIAIPLLILMLMLTLSVYSRAQEVISQQSGDASAGGGAIIEIGGDGNSGGTGQPEGSGAAVDPEQPVNITRNPGNTGIEMILGGQSQDGVAKRSNLPVVE